MADESDNSNSNSQDKENPIYARKKNLISGVDNDHLIIGMLGLLGAAIAAPHIKSAIDNIMKQYQNQMPHNGAANPQQGYLPQVQPVQQQAQQAKQQQVTPQHNMLREYEKRQAEQKEYQEMLEKENMGQSTSISMVPDRNTINKQQKKGGSFEAGSMVSGLST